MRINKSILKTIATSFLLFVLGIFLSCIYFLNCDINPNVISYNHPNVSVVQKSGGIRGEFVAQNNYLGLLTIRFDNKNIIEKKSEFKIKKKENSTWYHTSNIDTIQYNIKPLYTFGLPVIVDSKNKIYQFEINIENYVEGDPALMLSAQKPVFTSQYVFPWKLLLKDRHALLNFVQQKISYQLHNPYTPWVFLTYFLPLMGYLLYVFIPYKKQPHIYKINTTTLIMFIGIGIDIFILKNSYNMLALILSLGWIANILYHKIKPQTSILISLIFLIWCPFLLIAHMEWVGEKAANWVFILATIGFSQYFFKSITQYEE